MSLEGRVSKAPPAYGERVARRDENEEAFAPIASQSRLVPCNLWSKGVEQCASSFKTSLTFRVRSRRHDHAS